MKLYPVAIFVLPLLLAGSLGSRSLGTPTPAKTASVQPKVLSVPAVSKIETKPAKTKSAGKATPVKHSPVVRRLLVPPPPPNVPTISTFQQRSGESLLNGVVLEYLSKPELERLGKRLEQSLAKEKKASDERVAEFEEKKTKATEFEKLFSEGVVSRKELANAKREYEQAQSEKQELVDRSGEIQSDLDRVNKQLKSLSPSTSSRASSKPH